MLKKPKGKCLNEHQRCQIILKLSKTNALSKRAFTWEYNVSQGAMRKVWDNQEAILEQSALLFKEVEERTFRASVGWFTELEDMFYIWINSMHYAKLLVPPSLTIAKVKNIAPNLSIPESNFKASLQWLSRFRPHHGLQKMLLHGEGAEVNKNDLKLLAALKKLYEIIVEYDLENVYNMDKIGLFFYCFRDTYAKWQFITC